MVYIISRRVFKYNLSVFGFTVSLWYKYIYLELIFLLFEKAWKLFFIASFCFVLSVLNNY